MREAWTRIVTWCERYAPEVLANLNPGATDEQIAEAEAHLGVTFPDDLRELYRLHDGQKNGLGGASPFDVEEWLPLHDVVDGWDSWEELRKAGTFDGWETETGDEVSKVWWHPCWIPFAYFGAGGEYCVDMSPAEAGTVGQIIITWRNDAMRYIDTPSLAAWLGRIADDMESGELVYSVEEYQALAKWGNFDEETEWRGVGDGT